MKNSRLWAIWLGYYGLCVLLACVPSPEGALYGLLFLTGLGFFIPGGILLHRAVKSSNKRTLRIFRNLSAGVLLATLVTFLLNLLSITASRIVGLLSYGLLILVSVPMVCSQVWIVSLFLWACFLMVSLQHLKKT